MVVDIAPVSITVHDLVGRLLYANQKTFDLHGHSRDEFFAATLHDIDEKLGTNYIPDGTTYEDW
jgi:hypothetical protein